MIGGMDKSVLLLWRSHNNDQVVHAPIIHVAGAVTDTNKTYGAYVAAENNTFNNTCNSSSDSSSNSNSDSSSNRGGEHIDHLPMFCKKTRRNQDKVPKLNFFVKGYTK